MGLSRQAGSSGIGLAGSCLDSYFGLFAIESDGIRWLLVLTALFLLLFVCMNVFASATMQPRDIKFAMRTPVYLIKKKVFILLKDHAQRLRKLIIAD